MMLKVHRWERVESVSILPRKKKIGTSMATANTAAMYPIWIGGSGGGWRTCVLTTANIATPIAMAARMSCIVAAGGPWMLPDESKSPMEVREGRVFAPAGWRGRDVVGV